MSLTIHHLRLSQSERVVWLCEELTDHIPTFTFDVTSYDRDSVTAIAPPELKTLHPAGTAPAMVDSTVSPPVFLGETQAILEYITNIHGKGLFQLKPGDPDYATYLAWYNFSNGSLQPLLTRLGTIVLVLKQLERAHLQSIPSTEQIMSLFEERLWTFLGMINDHLVNHTYLAGVSFTAADIMITFSLTTMRGFYPINLEKYPNILRYLSLINERPAYKRAMARCNPGLAPMIVAEPEVFDFAAFK